MLFKGHLEFPGAINAELPKRPRGTHAIAGVGSPSQGLGS